MRHGATKRTQGDTTGALTQQVVRKQQERLADLRPADFEACQCAPQRRGPPRGESTHGPRCNGQTRLRVSACRRAQAAKSLQGKRRVVLG